MGIPFSYTLAIWVRVRVPRDALIVIVPAQSIPAHWVQHQALYLLSFPRFWTLSIKRFWFYFDLFWMAWHWKPAISWDRTMVFLWGSTTMLFTYECMADLLSVCNRSFLITRPDSTVPLTRNTIHDLWVWARENNEPTGNHRVLVQ